MKGRAVGLTGIVFFLGACVYHELPVTVNCNAVDISVEVIDTIDASVCGAEDGSFTIKVTGGEPPFTFSVNGQPEQSPAITGLASGFYSVVIYDRNRCKTSLDSVLISVDQFDVSFDRYPDDTCLSGNGSFEVTVSETNGPYQFKLDRGTFTPVNFFDNLESGDHFLTIQDNDGCNVEKRVTIDRGETGVSWENDILPIMTTSCALTGCHNGISQAQDWREYSEVKQSADKIRARTQDRSMPFGSTIPQDQIDLIACWVDDGAKEN